MERLTFGVTSSPFLATQVLRTLAQLYAQTHPTASATILTDFYVDDLLSGADDVDSADQRESGGRTQLNFANSYPTVFSKKTPTPLTSLHKALQKLWASTGTWPWTCSMSLYQMPHPTQLQSLPARILFQETWKRSLPWDKPVPEDIKSAWETWIADLPAINNLAIPRRLNSSNSRPMFTSLHGFCDASSVAYGAAIYLRTIAEDGTTSITLVVAKARVLPVKPITIPRAELLGAHLLAKMLVHTGKLLDIQPSQIFAWTDSEIVLYWIPKHPSQLDRFVANRIHAIQELLQSTTWRHVRSADNPADLASRGVRAPVLASSSLARSPSRTLACAQAQQTPCYCTVPCYQSITQTTPHSTQVLGITLEQILLVPSTEQSCSLDPTVLLQLKGKEQGFTHVRTTHV